MYVKNKMTVRPVTVAPETSVSEAFGVLKEKGFKRLPVVSNGKLVGIVTRGDLQTVAPSKATTLSVFEINYELSKLKVSDAMTKDPITIDENALLEEAAVMMKSNSVSALPVMRDGMMVGIITETDIFESFIEMMGFSDRGSRITIQAEDIPGTLSKACGIFSELGVNISHVAVYSSGGSLSDVVFRVNSRDTDELTKALEEHGYKVI